MKIRHDGSTELGQNAEARFEAILKSHKFSYRRATRHEDMFQHWDFQVVKQNEKPYTIEVKSMKRARRGDSQVNPNLIYVEFRNVNGQPGWLYGQADIIAFEQPDEFIIVSRTDLVEVAEHLVINVWANRPTPYQLYKRKDRPDEAVSIIHVNDLKFPPKHCRMNKVPYTTMKLLG